MSLPTAIFFIKTVDGSIRPQPVPEVVVFGNSVSPLCANFWFLGNKFI
jgi:hypothetical protein